MSSGAPSESVVAAVAAASDYMKSKDRLRKYRNRAIGVLTMLLALSAGAAGLAWYQLERVADATAKLSADGQRLAVGYGVGAERVVRIWTLDGEGGASDASPDSLKAARDLLILSPGGRFLVATTAPAGQTQLLDLSKGKGAKWEPLLEGAYFAPSAFSPDERYLGLGSDEGTLYIFDTKSSEGVSEVARLRHNGPVRAVAFSDDGRRVATTGANRNDSVGADSYYQLRVWSLRAEDLLAEAEAKTRDMSAEVDARLKRLLAPDR